MGLSHKRKAAEYVDASTFCSEVSLSPSKARRAAVKKRRSIDAIVRKAQEGSPAHQGNNAEVLRLRLETKKLECSQRKRESRREAYVRAVQDTARVKAGADRNLKREKEREAARRALQQVQKTVDLDNTELLRELERLNCSWTWHSQIRPDALKHMPAHGLEESGYLNPLEKLGLFIKDDEMTDEDLEIPDGDGDVEEGEISAENKRFMNKAAASHHFILQKEAIIVLETNRVSLSEKMSAPDRELGSPSKAKALRAARLKMRFADTIAKAQNTLKHQGKKADHLELKSDHEMLKKKEQKELASLEAEVRKSKIEKERAASRHALEQVKKTVDLDNKEVMEEVKRLNWSCGSCYYWNNEGLGLGNLNPLEKSGLFSKHEETEDEHLNFPVTADCDTEEGEITPIDTRRSSIF